jgi:Mn2+/Fe2+ NRAMP family transporter
MAAETELLWGITVGVGAVVVAVVVLLLGLLRESVRAVDALVGQVWSSAVSVFVHTVPMGRVLHRAERSAAAIGARLQEDPA